MKLDEFHQLKENLKRPLIMAHRGSSALLPENSPSAFLRAVEDGADVIETDLHFTRDGEIVLIHDNTLERTVEAAGPVHDFTLAELKRFNLKQPPERQQEVERILTLRELIELTGIKVPLALELKDPLFAQPEYGEKLVNLLRECGILGRCAVIGFNKQIVQQIEQMAPELVGGWITMTNPSPNQAVEMLGPFWPLLLINPFYVSWAHRHGKIVAPLDPDPDARLALYLRLGADVILTDNPAKTLQALKEKLK